jgi:hypothetical protein
MTCLSAVTRPRHNSFGIIGHSDIFHSRAKIKNALGTLAVTTSDQPIQPHRETRDGWRPSEELPTKVASLVARLMAAEVNCKKAPN